MIDFVSIRCDLNKVMIRWGLQGFFSLRGAAVSDWTCNFVRVPKTSRNQQKPYAKYAKLRLTRARLPYLLALLSRLSEYSIRQ
jgi:hypothetical protein